MKQGLEGQTRAQRQGKFTDNFIILVIAHIIHSLFLQSSTLSFSSFVEKEFSFKLCASDGDVRLWNYYENHLITWNRIIPPLSLFNIEY
jgi:hypothetical protein